MSSIKELSFLIEKEINSINLPDSPKNLYDPFKYILNLKGKRTRPLLSLLAYKLFNSNVKNALPVAIAIELFHNFTLIHDDIMDNAPIRRGNLTVHNKWDDNTAILSGDVMMITCYKYLQKINSEHLNAAINIFNNMAIKVCEGQQFDMDFELNKSVSISEYIKMIEYKTAELIASSLQLGSLVAGANSKDMDHMYNFGINIGLAFQLKDDLLDVFGSIESFGKQIGGDILSNKKTFLYLKAMQVADTKQKIQLEKLYSGEDSEKKIELVKDIFTKLNIEKHTVDLMKAYYTKAIKHLDAVNVHDKSDLRYITDKLMQRTS